MSNDDFQGFYGQQTQNRPRGPSISPDTAIPNWYNQGGAATRPIRVDLPTRPPKTGLMNRAGTVFGIGKKKKLEELERERERVRQEMQTERDATARAKEVKLQDEIRLKNEEMRERERQVEADNRAREIHYNVERDRREKEWEMQEKQIREERQARARMEKAHKDKETQAENRRQQKIAEEKRKADERRKADIARRRDADMKRRMNTPEALRNLRETIRTRYELDMEIYRMKDVRGPFRPDVVKLMQRSDAVLHEILNIVSTWDPNPEIWSEKEWELASDVKERLMTEGARWWAGNPPWEDED